MVEAQNQELYKISLNEEKVFNIITKSIGDELFVMKDGNIVHMMYNSEYKGIEYNVISQKLDPNGNMRVFDIRDKKWINVDSETEKTYIKEIKILLEAKSKIGVGNNPYKIQGSYNQKGKFKIADDRKGKAGDGKVCIEGGTRIPYLFDLFHHLNHLPFDNEVGDEINKLDKKSLVKILKNEKSLQATPFEKELDEMKLGDLKKLYTMVRMSKVQLCDSIERFLKGENPEKIDLVDQSNM